MLWYAFLFMGSCKLNAIITIQTLLLLLLLLTILYKYDEGIDRTTIPLIPKAIVGNDRIKSNKLRQL